MKLLSAKFLSLKDSQDFIAAPSACHAFYIISIVMIGHVICPILVHENDPYIVNLIFFVSYSSIFWLSKEKLNRTRVICAYWSEKLFSNDGDDNLQFPKIINQSIKMHFGLYQLFGIFAGKDTPYGGTSKKNDRQFYMVDREENKWMMMHYRTCEKRSVGTAFNLYPKVK